MILFAWMLWGDFCSTLMETVIPSILPLKLKKLDASNKLMGLLVTTIPSVMNFMINPIVSFAQTAIAVNGGDGLMELEEKIMF